MSAFTVIVTIVLKSIFSCEHFEKTSNACQCMKLVIVPGTASTFEFYDLTFSIQQEAICTLSNVCVLFYKIVCKIRLFQHISNITASIQHLT